ncbi:MAG: hypothetical protein QG567_719 [Campylobacterota bacterium]|nr:hypothetical protein [Campylobacterota bacterium]
MTHYIEGTLKNLYRTNEYVNKETGETTPSKYKIQLEDKIELKNGEVKFETNDISVPDKVAMELKTQIGKVVRIKCGIMAKGQIAFYGKE